LVKNKWMEGKTVLENIVEPGMQVGPNIKKTGEQRVENTFWC
jgi:hypothetical protein